MPINRYLTLLVPLLAFLLSEAYFFWPRFIYAAAVLAVLSFVFLARQFARAGNLYHDRYNFMILPSVFHVGLLAFSTTVSGAVLVQALLVFGLVFLYLYFRTLFVLTQRPESYRAETLGNLSSYGNFLAIFFIATLLYSLQSFLNIQVWIMIMLLLLSIVLAVYQILWVNGVNRRIAYFYVLLAGLALSELAWSISFLPLNYFVSGLIFSIYYYMLIGMIRFYLLNQLNAKLVKIYLLFGILSIGAVMMTAHWL